MEDTQLVPVEHNNQRILTTEQIAQFFGTTEKYINTNYQNNKSRYTEGKHFYRLEGEILRQFKSDYPENLGVVGPRAKVLFLWTEKGAWLLAKSLNTDEAWQACEMLVDDYYRRGEEIQALQQDNARLQEVAQLYQRIAERALEIEHPDKTISTADIDLWLITLSRIRLLNQKAEAALNAGKLTTMYDALCERNRDLEQCETLMEQIEHVDQELNHHFLEQTRILQEFRGQAQSLLPLAQRTKLKQIESSQQGEKH